MSATTPRAVVWWIIAIGILVRVVLGAWLGLGVDESYAVVGSRLVDLSYFDHPPLSFWLAHGSAVVLGSESHLAVRLPFILLFAATTWLIYRQTAFAFGDRAGMLAALFLNVSFVFSVSTGIWVLPDGPLMCALAAASYCLVRVLFEPQVRRAWWWWLGAGVSLGLALLSKYQGVLVAGGALLFFVTRPAGRRWLARPHPYVAVAVAVLLFMPVVIWNAEHHWASFAFQLGRGASPPHVTLVQRLTALGQNIGGQALWVGPWLWVPLVVVLVRAFTRRPIDDRAMYFACLALVPIGLFTLDSLGGQPGKPHWPAAGYLFLFPLLGAAIVARLSCIVERRVGTARPPGIADTRRTGGDRRLRGLAIWSAWCVGAFVALTVLAASAAITGWHVRAWPTLAQRDPTLEGVDWTELSRGLDSLGVLNRPHTFVAGTSWIQAGKIGYALGPSVPVLALSADPREFAYLHDPADFRSQSAVIVDRLPAHQDVTQRYATSFAALRPVGVITIRRRGTPVFDLGVYVGVDYKGGKRAYP